MTVSLKYSVRSIQLKTILFLKLRRRLFVKKMPYLLEINWLSFRYVMPIVGEHQTK